MKKNILEQLKRSTRTALGFLLERSLPESTPQREHVIEYIFLITLLLIS